ncbi:hypothetical protein BESB_052580 [Besnoitia besnoiti]|uniref:Uncharacterized protein n=1 Tax=Besnoitia besnoiti TaxID=94643 RepID=A0A2A9MJ37_BESBE|nr:hypothetical protein BESB_052580 [Besnoitia besnoiti]PFH35607.1 hypothetical protein BESB_052580 [Besnoitia besnoiti]
MSGNGASHADELLGVELDQFTGVPAGIPIPLLVPKLLGPSSVTDRAPPVKCVEENVDVFVIAHGHLSVLPEELASVLGLVQFVLLPVESGAAERGSTSSSAPSLPLREAHPSEPPLSLLESFHTADPERVSVGVAPAGRVVQLSPCELPMLDTGASSAIQPREMAGPWVPLEIVTLREPPEKVPKGCDCMLLLVIDSVPELLVHLASLPDGDVALVQGAPVLAPSDSKVEELHVPTPRTISLSFLKVSDGTTRVMLEDSKLLGLAGELDMFQPPLESRPPGALGLHPSPTELMGAEVTELGGRPLEIISGAWLMDDEGLIVPVFRCGRAEAAEDPVSPLVPMELDIAGRGAHAGAEGLRDGEVPEGAKDSNTDGG